MARKTPARKKSRSKKVRRICIMTGGGDAPGLNAVIHAVVNRATRTYGWEVVGSEDGFEGLIQAPRNGKVVPLDRQRVKGIAMQGGSILGCSNVANPWAYPKKHKDCTRYFDMHRTMLKHIEHHGIDAMIMVGGDGSMSMAQKLWELGVPTVGVPKTIDNDLAGTDRTFGFDTALHHATWAIDALHTTAHAHDRVMIAEVMGRHAGWIALHAGIAGGADIVLIPEIPYDVKRVIRKIRSLGGRWSSYGLIVCAEGAYPGGGRISVKRKAGKQVEGLVGHQAKLGGAGEHLRSLLAGKIPHDVRVTVLGHIQRGGSPTPFDRILAARFGSAAVDLVARSGFGRMVSLRTPHIVDVSLSEVVGQPHNVDPTGEIVEVARSLGVEMGA
ncbi:MAG: ATP-dependent 6-phosphofructokinase [Deltaproteobacteria bacterium]|nr:ATP-dependent 6-phosphofructokinase [Deltaproteobacteria bacterium]